MIFDTATIKGWCPGALRPMETGDGLIARLKIPGGIVAITLAERIAEWSRRWGNGDIELSSRANLQLRGIAAAHLPELLNSLSQSGLLDSSEAAEAVRNIISSPLAGFDPHAALDIRPIARDLEHRLSSDALLHRLPGKFGFAIDDGGLLSLDEVPTDMSFVAHPTADGPAFDIRLGGAPRDHFGPCRADAVAETAAAIAHVFLRAGSATNPRRMRDLVTALGAETIVRDAGLAPAPSRRAERTVSPSDFLGLKPLGSGAFVGVALRFGRITAEDLAALAATAAENGATELRLTPWRAILIPLPSARRLALASTAFILDPQDTGLRIAACPGAPSCLRATTRVRSDAARLAADLPRVPACGIQIHVSGCEKACAHPRPAPITLIARNGRYDLVRNGAASDPPIARHLTLDQARAHLRVDA